MRGKGTLTAYAGQTVTLRGHGDLAANNVGAYLLGQGGLAAKAAQTARAILQGDGDMLGVVYIPASGFALLPALTSIGGDIDDYGIGNASLPALFAYGYGGMYEPEQPVIGYGNLPPLVATGILQTINVMHGLTGLPALQGIGGDGHYGKGNVSLGPLAASGVEGEGRLDVTIFSAMLAIAPVIPQTDLVVIFTSAGNLVDAYTADRLLVQEMIESLEATGFFTLQAVMLQEFIAEAVARSPLGATVDNRPSLPGRAWVLNLETAASSQYDGYGFNSFFTRNGETYGVAEDGIYKLEGNTDAGSPINALLETGRSSFGSHKPKKILNIYLGVGADKALYLKVEADGKAKVYRMDNKSAAMKTQRVRVPHNMIGSHWNFTLMNQAGGDFDLSAIAFTPIPLARRI